MVKKWLNPNNTLEAIARSSGVSQARTSQIVREAATRALEAQGKRSDEIKPFTLPRRPLGERLRYRVSERGGGRLKEIAEAAKNSQDAETMMHRAALSPRQLSRHRTSLNQIGIEIPYLREPTNLDPIRDILKGPENYTGNLGELLSSLNYSRYLTLKREGLLIPLSQALVGTGFAVNRAVLDFLAESGFGLGHILNKVKSKKGANVSKYSFIAERQTQKLKDLMAEIPEPLSSIMGKVIQISGSETTSPSASLLRNSRFYTRTSSVFRNLKILLSENNEEFFNDPLCNVPVYKYRGVLYCNRRFEERLKLFVQIKTGRRGR